MATFQVPQFIETKPKLIGFLTLGQFGYIAVASLILFALYFTLQFPVWIILTLLIGGAAGMLAFGKLNGQSFPDMLRHAFRFAWNPRRYVWEREIPKAQLDISHIEKLEALRQRMKIEEKIKSVALGITTGKLFSLDQFRQSERGEKEKEHFQVVTYLTGERKLAKRIDY